MIPKIIHYCWFGGAPLPPSVQRCIDSWKKFCPEYEIMEWNEGNFDVGQYPYAREAYEAGKWAFVSDMARLCALIRYGGVYMDTDMELLAPVDGFLGFEGVLGFEAEERVSSGLIACVPGYPLIQSWLDSYEGDHFVCPDGSYDLTTCVERLTNLLVEQGLELNNQYQLINGCAIFPQEVLCPKDMETGKTNLTDKTVAIHHFDGSWLTEEEKLGWNLSHKLGKFLPKRLGGYLGKFLAAVKCRGLLAAIKEIQSWWKRKKGRQA